jgi:hypothetical protein
LEIRCDRTHTQSLAKIISKADGIQLVSPTPDGLHPAHMIEKTRIFDMKKQLAERASEKMGVGTFAAPKAGPGEIATHMVRELREAEEKIAALEAQVQTLESLHKECQKIIMQNQHLLTLATEPEIAKEKHPYPGQNLRDSPVFIRA